MIVTLHDAEKRWCPQGGVSACCRHQACMAWRWQRAPQLTAKTYVDTSNVHLYGGAHLPEPPELADLPAPARDPRWEAFRHNLDMAMKDWNPLLLDDASLPRPAGEGWELVTREFTPDRDSDDGPFWTLVWERPEDPTATGYCGLAGRPDQS